MKRHGNSGGAASRLLLSAMISATLAGCGGGGDSPAPAPAPVAPAPVPTTTPVAVTVLDGAISNATVCVDANRNGACDSGETSGRTDSSGQATLQVPNADVGQYPIIAMVGTDATDADSGAVTTAFVMKAPADQPSLVTPLTTLVQTRLEHSGETTAQAADGVKSQAGLSASPLADYRGGGNTAAATLARVLSAALQRQRAILASSVGTADVSGASIAQADVDRASASAVLDLLPALAAVSGDAGVSAATDKTHAQTAFANSLVDTQSPLTVASAPALIGADKLAAAAGPAPAPTPAPGAQTSAFVFTDSSNWQYRAYPATAQDNTPDADGLYHYYDLHTLDSAGVISSWGYGNSATSKDDVHWTGSAWAACPLGTRGSTTARAADGSFGSNYCQNHTVSVNRPAAKSIAGRTMVDVITEIRKAPGGDGGMTYAAFGPSNLGSLGTSTFPTGSTLNYQSQVRLSTAPAYTPSDAPILRYPDNVIVGGSATDSPTPACLSLNASNFASFQSPITTLEQLVAANPQGKPCVFNAFTDANGSSGPSPALWVWNTVSIGSVSGAATAAVSGAGANFYSSTLLIRAAFAPTGNGVTYYGCRTRTSGGSVWNCSTVGVGTWTITDLSDGSRLMTLSSPPAIAAPLTYDRVFVQRSGAIYYGYKNKVTSGLTLRLNLTATNALFTQLSVPALVPQ